MLNYRLGKPCYMRRVVSNNIPLIMGNSKFDWNNIHFKTPILFRGPFILPKILEKSKTSEIVSSVRSFESDSVFDKILKLDRFGQAIKPVVFNKPLQTYNSGISLFRNGGSNGGSFEPELSAVEESSKCVLFILESAINRLNLSPNQRIFLSVYPLLNNNSSFTGEGERHGIINSVNGVGGTLLNADSKGLFIFDQLSNEIKSSSLSLVNAQANSTNLRESLGTKINEKIYGDMLNYELSKIKEKSINITFYTGKEQIDLQLCTQSSGDYIFVFNGRSHLLDLKILKNLTSYNRGQGIISMHAGEKMDFSSLYDLYNDMLFERIRLYGSIDLRKAAEECKLNLEIIKKNSGLTEEEKAFKFMHILLEYNLSNSLKKGNNIPMIGGDYAYSTYGRSLQSKLVQYSEFNSVNSYFNQYVRSLGDSRNKLIISAYNYALGQYQGNLGKDGISLLENKVKDVTDKANGII